MTDKKTKITAEPEKQELFVSRDFDAPMEIVMRAHTDPKLFVRWFGCRGMTTKTEHFEAKTGGRYKLLQNMGGQEFSSYGVFHEVTHDRIVKTMEFGGYPGHVALETIRFEALPGNKTRLVTQSVFQSVTDRDGVVKSGFEKGAGESHDQLSELLVELKTT